MSNIYIQEPPTEGKVLLVTSAGDIDIELWSKESPVACRNFVQLCLEGYYDGSIFHRVIPGFIAQGGDPTGTGTGGESIYGKPFKDEFHSRLRFVRRGLVAMANGAPNDNGSQFFFTLGECQELQNKHTIFGKVAGDTIYNIVRFEEGEIGKDDRPEFPHKIVSTEVLKNPFPDIVPRQSEKIENEVTKPRRKKKGTKNFKLLSFGDEAQEDEEMTVVATQEMPNKSNSAHDIAMDPTLSSSIDQMKEREEALMAIREKLTKDKLETERMLEESKENAIQENDLYDKDNNCHKDKTRSEIKAEIRKLKRELHGKNEEPEKPNLEEVPEAKKPKVSLVLEKYYQDKEKYEEDKKKLPKKGVSRESQTLALLERFANKVKKATIKEEECLDSSPSRVDQHDEHAENDDDESWLTHRLQFDYSDPILAKDASTKDDSWYDLTDPRNALNKRRREDASRAAKGK